MRVFYLRLWRDQDAFKEWACRRRRRRVSGGRCTRTTAAERLARLLAQRVAMRVSRRLWAARFVAAIGLECRRREPGQARRGDRKARPVVERVRKQSQRLKMTFLMAGSMGDAGWTSVRGVSPWGGRKRRDAYRDGRRWTERAAAATEKKQERRKRSKSTRNRRGADAKSGGRVKSTAEAVVEEVSWLVGRSCVQVGTFEQTAKGQAAAAAAAAEAAAAARVGRRRRRRRRQLFSQRQRRAKKQRKSRAVLQRKIMTRRWSNQSRCAQKRQRRGQNERPWLVLEAVARRREKR